MRIDRAPATQLDPACRRSVDAASIAGLTSLVHAVIRVRSSLKASQSQTWPESPAIASIIAEGIGAGEATTTKTAKPLMIGLNFGMSQRITSETTAES